MITQRQANFWTRWVLAALMLSGLTTAVVPVLSADRNGIFRYRAQTDCARIGAAVMQMIQDTGKSPADRMDGERYACLLGEGSAPKGLFAPAGLCGDLASLLVDEGGTIWGEDWSGPYMMHVPADPWGQAYVVTITGFVDPDERPWVLSAGPDGVLETGPHSTEPVGDDIGITLGR